MPSICEVGECRSRAIYGKKGTKIPLRCSKHKYGGMIDVVNKTCVHEDCGTQPYYNIPGAKQGLYCKSHSLPGMINVRNKTCIHKDCGVQPRYNYSELKEGLYCATHKLSGMVNVRSCLCKSEGCSKLPLFNLIHEKQGIYCKTHSLPGMVNVRTKTCERLGCRTQPRYNNPGEKRGLYCKAHSYFGMVDVLGNSCRYDGCSTQPHYNVTGETTGLYCKTHKLPGMTDVKSKTCVEPHCTIQPQFNVPGEKQGLYCKFHSLLGMVNVKTKTCSVEECSKGVSYGLVFEDKTSCAEHRTKNMVRNTQPRCEICDDEEPCYSDTNYPKRCYEHKLVKDTNIVERRCTSCSLLFKLNKNSMCNDCSDFRDEQIRKRQEHVVRDFLKYHNVEVESCDTVPKYACSKRRPDFVLDYAYFKIILEVDENQHKSYACECEQSRMIQIHQDFGGTPLLFVRYNPDSYRVNGKLIRRNKKRLHVLLEFLEQCKNITELEYPLMVCYMYYDEYKEGQNKLIKLVY